ncbi:MAG: prolipoprotein diacylglyceryl transferase [Deltaproteobacteria bacterium]|nr:prolipoprotein diacylglyceryl transferase [Deltaproteobacteria bacterium]
MHPIMFRIPMPGWTLPLVGRLDSIPIYSYGVMLGLSLVVGWYLALGLAVRDGLPRETIANCYVVTAVAAIAGSRLLYIVTNLEEFHTFWDLLSLRRGGLVAYGGFLSGWCGSWAYLAWRRLRLLPWADSASPGLASGLLITRIGCYLFGCDYGKPLSEGAPQWLAQVGRFPHWPKGTLPVGEGSPAWVEHVKSGLIDQSATHSAPVHPTQLYESLLGAGLLVLLLLARKRQRFRGQIILLFFFAYGACRFLLEELRADPERGNLPPSLPEHLLIPACLAIFAASYAIGVARMIEHNVLLRRLTQVLAFMPALVAYLVLRPQTFAAAAAVQLSTSQFIAVATGLAAGAFFLVLDKAALAHPEAAMSLGLPEPEDEEAADADAADEAGQPARPARGARGAPDKGATRAKAKAAGDDAATEAEPGGGKDGAQGAAEEGDEGSDGAAEK